MRVLDLPGLPADVQVRSSPRRRRTVTAYREQGRTVVLVPARMSRTEVASYVRDLVARLDARDRRARPSDAELSTRAAALSARYLQGRAVPTSVRWVDNQRQRWGSCTPLDGSIRLSARLRAMPSYVLDYVLLHELAHLLVPGHGPAFHAWLEPYPHLERARAFLAGVDHATGAGLVGGDDAGCPDGAGERDEVPGPAEPVAPQAVSAPGTLW